MSVEGEGWGWGKGETETAIEDKDEDEGDGGDRVWSVEGEEASIGDGGRGWASSGVVWCGVVSSLD